MLILFHTIIHNFNLTFYAFNKILASRKAISSEFHKEIIKFIENQDKMIILNRGEATKIRRKIVSKKDSYEGLQKVIKMKPSKIKAILLPRDAISQKNYLLMMNYLDLDPTRALNKELSLNDNSGDSNRITLTKKEALDIKNFLANNQISYSRFSKKTNINKHTLKKILNLSMKISEDNFNIIKNKIQEIKEGKDLRFLTANELYVIKNILEKSSFSRKTLARALGLENNVIIYMTNNKERLSEVFIEKVFSRIRILFKNPIIKIVFTERFMNDDEIKFISQRITGNWHKRDRILKASGLDVKYDELDKLLLKKRKTSPYLIKAFIDKIKHLKPAKIREGYENRRYLTDLEVDIIKNRIKGSSAKRKALLDKVGVEFSVAAINALAYKTTRKLDEEIKIIINAIEKLPIIDSDGNPLKQDNSRIYRYLTDNEIKLIRKGYKGPKTDRANFIEKYELDINVKHMNLLINTETKMNINDIDIMMEKIPFKAEKEIVEIERTLTHYERNLIKSKMHTSGDGGRNVKAYLKRYGLDYKMLYNMVYQKESFPETVIKNIINKTEMMPLLRYLTDDEIEHLKIRFNGNGSRKIKILKQANLDINYEVLTRMIYRGKKASDEVIADIISKIKKLPISIPKGSSNHHYQPKVIRSINKAEKKLIEERIVGTLKEREQILKNNGINLSYRYFSTISKGNIKVSDDYIKNLMNLVKKIPIPSMEEADNNLLEEKSVKTNEVMNIKEDKLIYTYKGKEYTFLEKQSDSLIQYEGEWFETVIYTNDSGLKFYRSVSEFYSKFRLKTQ